MGNKVKSHILFGKRELKDKKKKVQSIYIKDDAKFNKFNIWNFRIIKIILDNENFYFGKYNNNIYPWTNQTKEL